jgi:hypothetical protein
MKEARMGRKLLAGVLGGIAFFLWSSLAHMVLPLGETGVQQIPNEAAVTGAMLTNIKGDGLYLFPEMHLQPGASRQEQNAAMQQQFEKIKTGPSGLLVYHPARDAGFGKLLLTELTTNIVQLLIAVFLLGQTRITSLAGRWRFVTAAGVLAAISTNISYWNWYGFPGNYTLAYTSTIAMGFVCAGLVAAALVKPEPATIAARA